MTVIMRTALAASLALLVAAPVPAQESVVRIPGASSSRFEAYLPPLPADMPWLHAAGQRPAAAPASPEAGDLRALLWQPTPIQSWPSTSQSATAATMVGG